MDSPSNRRLRQDRRDLDLGPPAGWRERRRCAERRLVEVTETSFREWVAYRAKWLTNERTAEIAPMSATPSLERSTSQSNDKRHDADRRKTEMGPPLKCWERRYNPERRAFEVREVSLDEWLSSIDLK